MSVGSSFSLLSSVARSERKSPPSLTLIQVILILIATMTVPLVEGSLSTNSAGHILSAPLQVYGNVSVVDANGVNQNLLALIQQQSTLLQQQFAINQQQDLIIQQMNATIQQLQSNVTLLSTQVVTPVYAHVVKTGTQSCTGGSFISVTGWSNVVDSHSGWDFSASTYRFPLKGSYEIQGMITFGPNESGISRIVALFLSSTTQSQTRLNEQVVDSTQPGFAPQIPFNIQVTVKAGDTMQIQVLVGGSNPYTVLADSSNLPTYVSISKVS